MQILISKNDAKIIMIIIILWNFDKQMDHVIPAR